MDIDERVIDVYEGQERGPLIIALGAVHGNEPAGVIALQEVFSLLHTERDLRPDFQFRGRLVGMIGNVSAYREGRRFIDQDLNRLWLPGKVQSLLHRKTEQGLHNEEREMMALLRAIWLELETYEPEELIILDLHTTSAMGGIFSIPLESDPVSVRLAEALHAPVVLGLLAGLEGTLMHYVASPRSAFTMHKGHIHSVAFEAGQHFEAASISRCISAVLSLLRAVGSIGPLEVAHTHDEDLLRYSVDLPRVTQISYVHHIKPGVHFVMKPGYENFQHIRSGEHLATDTNGPVYAPHDGFILMPLYQPQGSDGFFIVQAR